MTWQREPQSYATKHLGAPDPRPCHPPQEQLAEKIDPSAAAFKSQSGLGLIKPLEISPGLNRQTGFGWKPPAGSAPAVAGGVRRSTRLSAVTLTRARKHACKRKAQTPARAAFVHSVLPSSLSLLTCGTRGCRSATASCYFWALSQLEVLIYSARMCQSPSCGVQTRFRSEGEGKDPVGEIKKKTQNN